jgi:hypothetical protein
MVRLYGGGLQHGTVKIPCSTILSTLRVIQMFPRHFKQELPIREPLLERIRRTPESDFSMLTLLEDLQHGDSVLDLRTRLALVKRACESSPYIVKVSALELLERMSHEVHATAPEELPGIRSMLEDFDTNDINLNPAFIEALAAYDFVEPPVSPDAALSNLKAVIASGAPDDPAVVEIASLSDVSAEQFICDRAYGLLTNIFDDVFQGVYYEAYTSLSNDEKSAILCRAANTSRPGFSMDWILRELFRYGGASALPIYERFASVPEVDSFMPQEAVAAFVLGVQGCAKQGGVIPPVSQGESADVQAWRIIAEVLFLCTANIPVPDDIWDRFTGRVGLAAADVFYWLQRAQWRASDEKTRIDLVTRFPRQIRPILEECLRHLSSLSSIFEYGGSRDASVIRFLIDSLGSIGDEGSISVLTTLADDQTFGKDAVLALESIQSKVLGIRLPTQ